jgi:Probable cobalt transporter subunit (CbtA)
MEKRLIGRGILAGALAGLLAFLFARIFAEPQIQKAIDYEGAREKVQERLDEAAGLHPLHEHADVFSRAVQADVGLGVGMILFGAAMGALYGIAYTVCLGRTGGLRPRPLAFVIAGCGFLALYLVPFLKYPANPPAVGNADTIGSRTTEYFVFTVISIVVTVLSTMLALRVRDHYGTYTGLLAGVGLFVVVMVVAGQLMPTVNEVGDFPADTLWYFRRASLISSATLWGTIGVVLTGLVRPLAARTAAVSARRELASSL